MRGRRTRRSIAAAAMVLLVAACSGYTTPPTNIAKQPDGSYTAQLSFVGSCGAGGHCSWYAQYRLIGTSTWTHLPALPHGPVAGPVSNIPLSETATGLVSGAQYEYQVCGNDQPGQPFTCVGPDHTPNTTTRFTTPGAFSFPASVSSSHRYLLDQSGSPWLMVGESAQALIANASLSDAATYFADRQAKGINATWIMLIADGHPASTRSDGSTYDGLLPFTTPGDLSTPNPAYWQRVDQMLTSAAAHGVTVFANPAETAGMLPVLKNNGPTKDRNYGTFLGNRYKSFPNIVWLLGNDFQTWASDPTGDADLAALSDGIKSAGDTHLQTIELNYYASTSLDDTATWGSRINLNLAYSYYPTYDMVLHGYGQSPTMPVFFGEGNYEQTTTGAGFEFPVTTNMVRRQGWWTMTAGGIGQLWGTRRIQNWDQTPLNYLNTTGIQEYGYLQNFFKQLPWYNLVPDTPTSHNFVTAGYGTYATTGNIKDSPYVTAAVTPDGKLGVAYLPSTTTITINMAKLTGTTTAKWFDPTTGQYTTIGTFPNSGTHQFTSAGVHSDGSSDWVLVLKTS